MFFRIGLFDMVLASNVARRPTAEESITMATGLSGSTPGIAAQVIDYANAQLNLEGDGTNQANTLFDDCWMLGYISGLATAAAADNYITDEIEILGLTTRTVGELAGGGLPNKVIAHEKILGAWGDSAFQEGSRQGKTDWNNPVPRDETT